MSEETRKAVKVSQEAEKLVHQFAEKRSIPAGEAVDKLITTGYSRLTTLARFAKNSKDSGKPRASKKKSAAKKTAAPKRTAAKRAAAKKASAPKKAAKKASAPKKHDAPHTKANGAAAPASPA